MREARPAVMGMWHGLVCLPSSSPPRPRDLLSCQPPLGVCRPHIMTLCLCHWLVIRLLIARAAGTGMWHSGSHGIGKTHPSDSPTVPPALPPPSWCCAPRSRRPVPPSGSGLTGLSSHPWRRGRSIPPAAGWSGAYRISRSAGGAGTVSSSCVRREAHRASGRC